MGKYIESQPGPEHIEISTRESFSRLPTPVKDVLVHLAPQDARHLIEGSNDFGGSITLDSSVTPEILRLRAHETLEVTDLPLKNAIDSNAASWAENPYTLNYSPKSLTYTDIAFSNKLKGANDLAFGPNSKGRRDMLQRSVTRQQIEDTVKFLLATGAVSATAGPIAAYGGDKARFLAKWLTTAFYDTAILFLQRQPDIDGGNMMSKLRNFIGYALKNDKTFLATGIGGGAVYTGISELDPNGPANFVYLIGPVMNSVFSSLRSANNLAKKHGESGVLAALRHVPQMYRQNPGHFATDMTAVGLTGMGIATKLATGINTPILDIVLNSGVADTAVSLGILLSQYGIYEANNHIQRERRFKQWTDEAFTDERRRTFGISPTVGNIFASAKTGVVGL